VHVSARANFRVVCCWSNFLPTPLTFVCKTQNQHLRQLKCRGKCITRLISPLMHFWETAWKKKMSFCIETEVRQRLAVPCSPAVQPWRPLEGWLATARWGPQPGLCLPCRARVRCCSGIEAAFWAFQGLMHLRVPTVRKRAWKLMCIGEGSVEHRYFWICGCSSLPRFAPSLSPKQPPRLMPPSSDLQALHFPGKPLRTFHSPCSSLSHEIKCCHRVFLLPNSI